MSRHLHCIRSWPLIIMFMLHGCTECNGGSSQPDAAPADAATPMADAAPMDTMDTGLSVISTDPPHTAVDIEPGVVISATFDKDLAPVDSTMFFIRDPRGELVAGQVGQSGAAVTFTPQRNLALQGVYTATLSTEITDLAGSALASEHTWTFTVRDGVWGDPVELSAGDAIAGANPSVALSGAGEPRAVWLQQDPFDALHTSVWTSIHDQTLGWSTPGARAYGVQIAFNAPRIVANPVGEAIATWDQYSEFVVNAQATSYSAGSWTGVSISPGFFVSERPYAAMAGTRGMVTWRALEASGGPCHVLFRDYDMDTGWSGIDFVKGDDCAAYPLEAAMSTAGHTMVILKQRLGTGLHDLVATRYVPGTGWSSPGVIDGSAADITAARMAMNDQGDAMLVWARTDSGQSSAHAALYDPATGTFSQPHPLAAEAGHMIAPRVAINASGSAVAVWWQRDQTLVWDPWASVYTPGTGWSTAEKLAIGHDQTLREPAFASVSMDALGNALALWEVPYENATGQPAPVVMFHRHIAGAGWGAAGALTRDPVQYGTAGGVDGAIHAPDGTAWALFGQGGAIYARHFE